MSEAEFWRSTPYLTRLAFESAAEREKRSYQRALFTAWHVSAFTRAKRIPPLDSLLRKIDGKPRRHQTPEEMMATVEMLNAAFGGDDYRNKTEH